MMKGFSYIELMVVMALIVIIAAGGSFALFSFIQEREPEAVIHSIIAALRDAEQRSITQEEGMYWGVRFFYDFSGRHSYALFKSSDASGNSIMDVSIVYMRNNVQFSEPAQFLESASERKIIFDKITGRRVLPVCVADTENVEITVNGISARVYCNGKIE